MHNRGQRALRLSGLLPVAYLVAMSWVMVRQGVATGELKVLAVYLAITQLGVGLLVAAHKRWRMVHDWLPLLVGPFLYVSLGWIIAGLGLPHQDALVLSWEAQLFPSHPSSTLALRWPSRALSELLHFAYASYYLLVYVPPIVLYARGKRDDFAATVLALTVVYAACFITYTFFPVDGPRFLVGPAAAPDGPIRSFVLALLDRGSSRGTAFPSSHVAASVVSALCALRYQRPLGIVVASLAALLTLSTVYGGFHYAVDAVAGVVLGLVAYAAAFALWRALPARAD